MQLLKRSSFFLLTGFFLFAFGILLLTGSGRPKTTDEYMIFFQAESFWGERNFAVPQAVMVFNHWYGKLGLDGRPHSPYGILHAFLLSPCIGLGKLFFSATKLTPDKWILAGPFIASLFSSLALVLSALLLGLIALRGNLSQKRTLLLLLSFLFATPAAAYGGTLFSEPLTMLIWTFVVCMLSFLRSHRVNSFWYLVGLGMFAALPGWIRPNQFIYLPIISLAVFLMAPEKKWQAFFSFVVPAACVVATLLFYNQKTYGSFFDFGYPDFAETGKKLNEFKTPFWQGLYILVASPGKSFFLYAPVSFLLLWASKLWKQNSWMILAAGMLSVYLIFFSLFSGTEGGYCFGPRFFLNILPFVYVALIPAIREAKRPWLKAFCILSFIGFLINFPALFTSFLEEQVDHGYYGPGFVYQINHADSWAQWKMLTHYLQVSFQGGFASVPLGMGWDLGFVFLAKAGVTAWVWKGILSAALAMMGLGFYLIFFKSETFPKKASQKSFFD